MGALPLMPGRATAGQDGSALPGTGDEDEGDERDSAGEEFAEPPLSFTPGASQRPKLRPAWPGAAGSTVVEQPGTSQLPHGQVQSKGSSAGQNLSGACPAATHNSLVAAVWWLTLLRGLAAVTALQGCNSCEKFSRCKDLTTWGEHHNMGRASIMHDVWTAGAFLRDQSLEDLQS